MTRFQRLALATAIATYILVVIGGMVRVTNSGLSCPDWPTCNGSIVPAFNPHVLVEYTHRLFASLVSVLVVATAAVAWRSYRRDRTIVGLATAGVGLLVAQILLGAATVTAELPASVVTAHLGNAMLLLGCVILLTLVSFQRRRAIVRPAVYAVMNGTKRFRAAAFVAAGGMYGLLLSGAYVASSGAGTSCSTWPLCNGEVFPHGNKYVDIHFTHRILVVLVTVALVVLAIGARRWLRDQPVVRRLVRDSIGLFIVQIMLGAFTVWTKLATGMRILHLATGSALWVALVVIAWMSYAITRRESLATTEGAGRFLRGSARPPQEVAG